MKKTITIDGPAGSGKSTVAQIIARIFNFKHVNSGLFYRYLNFKSTEALSCQEIDNLKTNFIFNEKWLSFLENPPILFNNEKMHINLEENISLSFFKGIDLLPFFGQIPSVRAMVKSIQKKLALNYNIVADGRDCGTVVFPEAQAKIFLTASLIERADRIFSKQKNSSVMIPKEIIMLQTKERDFLDESRLESPLIPSKDAIIINSTGWSLEETIKTIICKIAPKLISK